MCCNAKQRGCSTRGVAPRLEVLQPLRRFVGKGRHTRGRLVCRGEQMPRVPLEALVSSSTARPLVPGQTLETCTLEVAGGKVPQPLIVD